MATGLSPQVILVAPASTKIGLEILTTLAKENQQTKRYELAGLIPQDSIGKERKERLDKMEDLKLSKTRSVLFGIICRETSILTCYCTP